MTIFTTSIRCLVLIHLDTVKILTPPPFILPGSHGIRLALTFTQASRRYGCGLKCTPRISHDIFQISDTFRIFRIFVKSDYEVSWLKATPICGFSDGLRGISSFLYLMLLLFWFFWFVDSLVLIVII